MLTYNRARFIAEAIESVLAQTYQNWELVIIDDGSTDGTEAIVRNFSDHRIRYIRNSANKGLLVRRQESLTYATGVYVAVLDSDDSWSSPEKIAQQVMYLETHPGVGIVGTWITLIDETGRKIKQNRYHLLHEKIRCAILWRNQFAHSSILMRREMLEMTEGYRFPLAEDLDLFLQLGALGSFANLPQYATNYRIHHQSETSKKSQMIECILKIIHLHSDKYPNGWYGKIKYSLYKLLSS